MLFNKYTTAKGLSMERKCVFIIYGYINMMYNHY